MRILLSWWLSPWPRLVVMAVLILHPQTDSLTQVRLGLSIPKRPSLGLRLKFLEDIMQGEGIR